MAEGVECSGVHSRKVLLSLLSAMGWLDGGVVNLIQDLAGKLVDVTMALFTHLLSRRFSSQLSGFLHISCCAGRPAGGTSDTAA